MQDTPSPPQSSSSTSNFCFHLFILNFKGFDGFYLFFLHVYCWKTLKLSQRNASCMDGLGDVGNSQFPKERTPVPKSCTSLEALCHAQQYIYFMHSHAQKGVAMSWWTRKARCACGLTTLKYQNDSKASSQFLEAASADKIFLYIGKWNKDFHLFKLLVYISSKHLLKPEVAGRFAFPLDLTWGSLCHHQEAE